MRYVRPCRTPKLPLRRATAVRVPAAGARCAHRAACRWSRTGFRTFYETTNAHSFDRSGIGDGDDVGVVGDSSTSMGGGGGGRAPHGTQFYMMEDTGGGFLYVAVDAIDVRAYTNAAAHVYVHAENTAWETR